MDTYSLLREFADSWMLIFLTLVFTCGDCLGVSPRQPQGSRTRSRHPSFAMMTNLPRAIVGSQRWPPIQGGVDMSPSMTKRTKRVIRNTTGHSWDGIEEFDNPMPRWWLWTFYVCIALGACVFDRVSGLADDQPGNTGRSGCINPRRCCGRNSRRFDGSQRPDPGQAGSGRVDRDCRQSQSWLDYANNAGAAVFRTWCAQCHGSGAAGVQASGYPNLLDDDWIWGGDIEVDPHHHHPWYPQHHR